MSLISYVSNALIQNRLAAASLRCAKSSNKRNHSPIAIFGQTRFLITETDCFRINKQLQWTRIIAKCHQKDNKINRPTQIQATTDASEPKCIIISTLIDTSHSTQNWDTKNRHTWSNKQIKIQATQAFPSLFCTFKFQASSIQAQSWIQQGHRIVIWNMEYVISK